MQATDFEYDGQYLSDYGFIVCTFDDNTGVNTATAGSSLTFNVVRKYNGKRFSLINTSYDECLQVIFDICKDPEITSKLDMEITNEEYRDISRWLNRKKHLKFQAINPEGNEDNCYYNSSFNIEKITIADKLYGLRLTMETDSPFGYGEVFQRSFTVSNNTTKCVVMDESDEIGETAIDLIITNTNAGTVEITNETTGKKTIITNCASGEIIRIRGDTQSVVSSVTTHNVYNDFNYIFPKIQNTFNDRKNVFSSTNPCTMVFRYTPIIRSLL